MRRLFPLLLLLIVSSRVDATLTITNYGTLAGAGTVSSLVFNPNATMPAGTLGVVLYVFNNSGAGGSTKIFTAASFTDSQSNTWTRQLDTLYDPTNANSGMELAVYTAPLGTALATTDNISVSVSTNTVPRIVTAWTVSGLNGAPTVVTAAGVSDGLTTGQSGTAISVTTSSITSGDAVIAWSGFKNSSAATGSSDTTNGTWSAGVSQASTTQAKLYAQYKITTGTGTIPWAITIATSAVWHCAWIQIREAVPSQSATNGFF